MASLKCSKCGNGIHYHDEPNGTEWIAFEINTWNKLISSTLELSSYKLATDAGWYTLWKCKECGTLHVFKAMDIYIQNAYERVDLTERSDDKCKAKYIVFEDVIWDEITETDETGAAFSEGLRNTPKKYAVEFESSISVYADEECANLEGQYESISSTSV